MKLRNCLLFLCLWLLPFLCVGLSSSSPSDFFKIKQLASASSASKQIISKISLGLTSGALFSYSKSTSARQLQKTNEIVKEVNGIKQKRLGGSGDIIVSELGLGTQRWVSEDFNAPDEKSCFDFLDLATANGINLIDTAEQYPIPSSKAKPEGLTETTIGKWIQKDKSKRSKLVITTKITGGRAVNKSNIQSHCENSLARLQTDYIDLYLLHWPARYTPQSNWGQSLSYHHDVEREPYYSNHASFEEIAIAMNDLIKQGKIRGWGMCNDNCFGLTASCEISKRLGLQPPRCEENGVSEASSSIHENVGFMAYNVLAGGLLTGKYLNGPLPTPDNPSLQESMITRKNPRGRHDDPSWGRTLYRYRSEAAMSAINDYDKLAKKYKISLTELSLLWCRQRNPFVTTSLIGSTSKEQLSTVIKIFQNSKKDLPDQLMWEIDRIHMRNRLPIFSSNRVGGDWNGEGEIGELLP